MVLSVKSQYKYLGRLLTNDLRDDSDFLKNCALFMLQLICFLENSVLLKYKLTLCYAMLFGSTIYGCQLWCNFCKESFNRLGQRVAYNNALRLLLSVPPWSSATELLSALCFPALIHKQVIMNENVFDSSNDVQISPLI